MTALGIVLVTALASSGPSRLLASHVGGQVVMRCTSLTDGCVLECPGHVGAPLHMPAHQCKDASNWVEDREGSQYYPTLHMMHPPDEASWPRWQVPDWVYWCNKLEEAQVDHLEAIANRRPIAGQFAAHLDALAPQLAGLRAQLARGISDRDAVFAETVGIVNASTANIEAHLAYVKAQQGALNAVSSAVSYRDAASQIQAILALAPWDNSLGKRAVDLFARIGRMRAAFASVQALAEKLADPNAPEWPYMIASVATERDLASDSPPSADEIAQLQGTLATLQEHLRLDVENATRDVETARWLIDLQRELPGQVVRRILYDREAEVAASIGENASALIADAEAADRMPEMIRALVRPAATERERATRTFFDAYSPLRAQRMLAAARQRLASGFGRLAGASLSPEMKNRLTPFLRAEEARLQQIEGQVRYACDNELALYSAERLNWVEGQLNSASSLSERCYDWADWLYELADDTDAESENVFAAFTEQCH